MDVVSSLKEKVADFRIKELKDVLAQLGISKQGKKQDLVERILGLLSDDQVSKAHNWGKKNTFGKDAVAKVIDGIYRKRQAPGSVDSALKSHSVSDMKFVKPKDEYEESNLDMKIRCLCGSSLATESMIKCEDPRCQVWQHISCVIIPEKGLDNSHAHIPPRFFCEVCRLNKADPFWVTVAHPLLPLKLAPSSPAADGTTNPQHLERMFQLSRADRDLLQKNEYDLQAWCILLNDKVPFRMQWPQSPGLSVNGIPVRTTNRPETQLLGANGRDDGPVITTFSKEGINKIIFSRCDARTFCFGLRIAKRRTLQQVLNLIPKEKDGERFEEALARVRRCVGHGTSADNADSDSDLEVVAESVTVNLRCPMSGSRIKTSARFKPCVHMGCFDLETFVALNQRSRKWQCPICLKNYSLESIVIDPYFNRITSQLRNCEEDISEVEVKPDGSWRAKAEGELKALGQWHLPDGSVQVFSHIEPELDSPAIAQQSSKQESTGLKLGIRKNPNGTWEVSRPSGTPPSSSGNTTPAKPRPFAVSTATAASFCDGEVSSVDLSASAATQKSFHAYSPPQTADDVIILSDSEEDNVAALGEAMHRYDITTAGGTIPFAEADPPATSCLGLFGGEEEYEIPLWPHQTGPGFQLFDSDANSQDFSAAGHLGGGNGRDQQMRQHEVVLNNPLGFAGDDPSLQIFLPTQPAGAGQPALGQEMGLGPAMPTDDWISLRLGGADGDRHLEPATTSASLTPFSAADRRMDTLADTATLLLSMNERRGAATNSGSHRSGALFPPTQQQTRSVRPRLHLSIDSD
ncbi:DNA-binding protein with MIZ/SP-RING zinc finger, PHD-finger and SAP domain-containing protein isoform X2 [Wolffia australiana]